MKGLVLVGTVHLDPQGHAALLALLHELKPDAVTVEVSSYAIEYRRTAGPEVGAVLEGVNKLSCPCGESHRRDEAVADPPSPAGGTEVPRPP